MEFPRAKEKYPFREKTGIVRTVLYFADDAPQHFEQPDRSLHPTMATIHAIY